MKGFKEKNFFYIGIIVCVVIVIAVTLYAFLTQNSQPDSQEAEIYYLDTSSNELKLQNVSILEDTDVKKVDKVIELMQTPPQNTTLTSVFKDGVNILTKTLKKDDEGKGVLEINFSNKYLFLKETEEIFLRTALVYSLTSLPFIDSVRIYVEGNILKNDIGQNMENLNKDNVLLNPTVSPEQTNNRVVTLYFSDDKAMGLKKEQRSVTIKQSQSVENQIVEQLIQGPMSKELFSTIPPETKIRNVKTEENVCYVDLSSEFVSKHTGGSTAEVLTIYSIVNSLTELKNVDKVRFLIEGEKVTEFKGHLDLSKAFERDEGLILDD